MKIAILGAGFAGLAAGYELTKNGHDVTIFEKEPYPGGLASGFKKPNWEWPLERAYHHLFTSDWHARNLLTEIGMGDKLFFERPITASLYSNFQFHSLTSNFPHPTSASIFQLDSPLSLLKFPLLPVADRMRTGLILAYLKATPFWKDFEKTTAKEWLTHFMGQRSWNVLWEPLLAGKFGSYADKISMAWFWARIKKRSPSLGYINGGFQSFAEGIARKIEQQGGTILYSTTVEKALYGAGNWKLEARSSKIEAGKETRNLKLDTSNLKHRTSSIKNQASSFDIVLSTLPTPIFTSITPQLPKDYVQQISSIPHLHALSLILELKQPFLPPLRELDGEDTPKRNRNRNKTNTSGDGARDVFEPATHRPYWLNICDPTWPFLAVVEHTNFVDPSRYGNSHMIYIGNYLPREHEYFKKSKEELLKIFLPYLSQINPKISNFKFQISNFFRFVGPFAQPVVGINYSKVRPPLTTPLPNLFMANLDSVYPWDRGTNYAIELGQNAANMIV